MGGEPSFSPRANPLMSGQVVHPVVCSPLNEHMMFQSPRVGASSSPPRPQSGRRIPRRVSIPSWRGKLFTNGGKAYGFVREFQSPHVGASTLLIQRRIPTDERMFKSPHNGAMLARQMRISPLRGFPLPHLCTGYPLKSAISNLPSPSHPIPSCRGKFFTASIWTGTRF